MQLAGTRLDGWPQTGAPVSAKGSGRTTLPFSPSSPFLSLLPIPSSIKLDPNSRDRAEKIIFPTGRVSALTISFPPSPRLESNSLSPRKNAQRVNSILVHPFPRVPPADTRCSNDAHVGHVSLRCEDSLREGRGSIVIFYNVSFGTHDEPV